MKCSCCIWLQKVFYMCTPFVTNWNALLETFQGSLQPQNHVWLTRHCLPLPTCWVTRFCWFSSCGFLTGVTEVTLLNQRLVKGGACSLHPTLSHVLPLYPVTVLLQFSLHTQQILGTQAFISITTLSWESVLVTTILRPTEMEGHSC